MGNKGVLAFGIILVLVGVVLIFSSLDLKHLNLLDLTVKTPAGEVTATNLPPGAEGKIMAGLVISVIGIALVIVGK